MIIFTRFFTYIFKDKGFFAFFVFLSSMFYNGQISPNYSTYTASVYVKPNGTGNGNNWNNAADLNTVLKWVEAGGNIKSRLFINMTEGTYVPTEKYGSTNDYDRTFMMYSNIALYGGYSADNPGGSPIRPKQNETILDGRGSVAHVIISAGGVSGATLNGLTVKGGNANYATGRTVNGTGINAKYGGGIYVDNAELTITNCYIVNNYAKDRGAGLYLEDKAKVDMFGVLFANNTADSSSGDGGAIFINNNTTSMNLVNSTLVNNSANDGGGIRVDDDATILMFNNIFYQNTSTNKNGTENAELSFNTNKTSKAKFLTKNGDKILNNLFHYFKEGTKTINKNPLLVDYRPSDLSPALDSGTNESYVPITSFGGKTITDATGLERVKKVIDRGALENQNIVDKKYYVRVNGMGDGSSWANASGDLQLMVNQTVLGDEVWVAAGTYTPQRNYGAVNPADKDKKFTLENGVKLYGGFPPTGNPGLADRNVKLYASILSGKISPTVKADNVVYIHSLKDPRTGLDGFTVKDGVIGIHSYSSYATFKSISSINHSNSGFFVYRGTVNITNTLIANNTSRGVTAYPESTVNITNCTISKNNIGLYGTYNPGSSTSVITVRNTILYGNTTKDSEMTGIVNIAMTNSLLEKEDLSYYNASTFLIDKSPFVDINNNDFTLKNDLYTIDTGIGAYYAVSGGDLLLDKDLNGNPRVVGKIIDLGAFESSSAYTNFYQPNNGVLYVKKGATGSGDGSSWSNAAPELADVLKWINGPKGADNIEIWVAEGTYLPKYSPIIFRLMPEAGRDNTFLVQRQTNLYGGFKGNETQLSQRNWALYPTILSGDLGVAENDSDNAHHVMVIAAQVIVDGFTITKGRALFNHEILDKTYNKNLGGGVLSVSGNSTFNHINFIDNSAEGGGAYTSLGVDHTKIVNSIMQNNIAKSGSASYVYGSELEIINTSIINNTSQNEMFTHENKLQTGAIFVSSSGNTGKLSLYNSILYNNKHTVGNYPALVGKFPNSPAVNIALGHNYFDTTTWADLNGTNEQGNILSTDSPFKNHAAGDFTLDIKSAAVDGGNQTKYEAEFGDLDLSFNPRTVTIVDMGAYEIQSKAIFPSSNNILYVNKNVIGGAQNGSDWENALTDLSAALNWARKTEVAGLWTSTEPLQIWITADTYFPKNKIASKTTKGEETTARDQSFLMVKNVQIIGGFNGTEESITQKDNTAKTILDGDIGIANENNDNVYHVVTATGNLGVAKLENIIIRNGQATGVGEVSVDNIITSRDIGGGLFSFQSNFDLKNVDFTNNASTTFGGSLYAGKTTLDVQKTKVTHSKSKFGSGIYYYYSTVKMENVEIKNNTGATDGAGLYSVNTALNVSTSSISDNISTASAGGVLISLSAGGQQNYEILFNKVDIINNESGIGAGFLNNNAVVTLSKVNISSNKATNSGGGIYNANGSLQLHNSILFKNFSENAGGGIYTANAGLKLFNSIMYNNYAYYGGALFSYESSLEAINNTLVKNYAPQGSVLYNYSKTSPMIGNSIIYNNGDSALNDFHVEQNYATIFLQNNILEDTTVFDGTKLINAGANILIPENASPFKDITNNNFELKENSVAINTGNNTLYTSKTTLEKDYNGAARIIGSKIDIGAYESAFGDGSLSNSNLIKPQFQLYPNPSADYINLKTSEKIDQIVLFDLSGAILPTKMVNNQIDIRHLNTGVYILTIKLGEKFYSEKIIKK